MKYYYLLIIALMIGCNAKQTNNKQISLGATELVYLNHFNAVDTFFWVGNDGENYAEIDEGYYYYESIDSIPRFNAPNFPITNDDNFSVEIGILSPSNEDSIFYGLMMGEFSPRNYTVDLLVNDLGQYTIFSENLLSSGNYEMGLISDLNKIEILKKGIITYFYINDKLVFDYPLDSINNFRCGPTTRSAIWMDYIKIEKEKR